MPKLNVAAEPTPAPRTSMSIVHLALRVLTVDVDSSHERRLEWRTCSNVQPE